MHLTVQNLDRRLCLYDKVTKEHTNGDEHPSAAYLRKAGADSCSGRNEANVCARKEDCKTDKDVCDTDAHSDNLTLVKGSGQKLE